MKYAFLLSALLLVRLLPAQILNWTYNDMLTDVQESGANPDMVMDADGNVHVSFWDSKGDRLAYAKRDKATSQWTISYPDAQQQGGFKSAIVLDANKKAHIAYFANDFGTARLRYTTNKSGSWVTTAILDTMSVGKYGLNTAQKQFFQSSIDLRLQANGNPFIACFDSDTDFESTNISCPYFNSDLNITYVYKSGNNWVMGRTPTVTVNNVNQCIGKPERMGEFLQILPANDGGYHIFANSFFNHKIVRWKSNGTNFNQWTVATVDSSTRSSSTISASNQAQGAWNTYRDLSIARIGNSDSVLLMYGYCDFFGFGQFNNQNYFFMSRVRHEDLGTANANHFYRTLNTNQQLSTQFSKFSIASHTGNTVLMSYFCNTNGGLYARRAAFNGQQVFNADTIVAGNFNTTSQLQSATFGDTLYILVHDANTDQLKMVSKRVSDVSNGVSGGWKWETITQSEQRGAYLASEVVKNTNGDILHLAFDDQINKQLYYGTKTGTGAWAYEAVGSPNVRDIDMTLRNGQPFIVYVQSNENKLKGAYKTGGNWNTTDLNTNGFFASPSVVAVSNQLHVLYQDAQAQKIRYATGTIGGTWTNSSVADTAVKPMLVADANGNLHASFYENIGKRLMYAYKPAGGSWTTTALSDSGEYEVMLAEVQVNSATLPAVAFLDWKEKMIFVKSKQANGSWVVETAVDFNGSALYGNPFRFRIDKKDQWWVLYNYPNAANKGIRLARKDMAMGNWLSVSVNNNLGEVAQTFDFNIPDTDFYVFGKKNQAENEGIAYLFAADGTSTDMALMAMNDLEVRMYPNPASELVHFSCETPEPQTVRVQLYDLSGQLLVQLASEQAVVGEWRQDLDISGLPAGVYFCKWQIGKVVFTQKLLK